MTVAGTEITTLKDTDLTKLRRDNLGFVFQFFNLLPVLTAEENIALPLSIAGGSRQGPFRAAHRFHRPRRPPLAPAVAALRRPAAARPIARALVSQPAVVFADEPTGNLDSKDRRDVLELLRHAVDEFDQTVVMVTHEAHAAVDADRVLSLADGLIVRELRRAPHEIIETMDEVTKT